MADATGSRPNGNVQLPEPLVNGSTSERTKEALAPWESQEMSAHRGKVNSLVQPLASGACMHVEVNEPVIRL